MRCREYEVQSVVSVLVRDVRVVEPYIVGSRVPRRLRFGPLRRRMDLEGFVVWEFDIMGCNSSCLLLEFRIESTM